MNRFLAFEVFWKKHPLLFYGICTALASAAALAWHACYLLPIGLLLLPGNYKHLITKVIGGVLLASATFAYTKMLYPVHELENHKIAGTAYFSISALKIHASPFQRFYQYTGTVESFHADNGAQLTRIPCRIYVHKNAKRPVANSDYLIEGTLCQKAPRHFIFKPTIKKPWRAIPHTFSLAELRYKAKDKVRAHLKRHIEHPRSRAFLAALFTGDIDERSLTLEFNHLGLQHILAISGFHFALLAAFFGFFLRIFFGSKTTAALLIALLSAYFIFIGNAPSIQRGWLAIFIFIIGHLLDLRTTGLNALGAAVIAALIIDPAGISDLGFQLSYLSTFGILLLYPTINNYIGKLLPKRSHSIVAKMSLLDQHGYILSALLRETCALNLAVHCFALPAVLFTFHKFPLLSLFYNLFFPFWANLVFLLLLAALLFSICLPPLGHLLHTINDQLTATLLEFTAHPPAVLDFFLRLKTFPLTALIVILCAIFAFAINIKKDESAFTN